MCLSKNSKGEEVRTEDLVLDPEFLLNSAGSWNRYQGFITTVFIVIAIFFTYSHYLPILYLYVPEHYCRLDHEKAESTNFSQAELKEIFIPKIVNGSGYEKCFQYDVDIDKVLESGVTEPQDDWNVIRCRQGWTYEKEDYYESVATEFNLVCENSWLAPLTETIYFIGSALGMLLYGWIGDHYGRFWTIMICNWSVFIAGFSLGFSPNVVVYTVIRFVMGISTVNCLTSSFVLGTEYVSKDKRTFIGNFAIGVGIALAGFIMPGLLYKLKNWRLVNHILFAQGSLTLALPFLINESIRWLLERQDYEKVIEIIEKVAKFNGKKLDKHITLDLNNCLATSNRSSESAKKEVTSFKSCFKTPRLRRHIIIMIILWAMVKLLFETQLRSIRNLDIHIFYSYAIANFMELIADIIIIWTMEWFGRRWMTLFCMTLSAIPLLVASYYTVNGGSHILLLILNLLARFGFSMVINVVLQFKIEICPTDLRTRALGFILFVGELAAFLSPVVLYSSTLSEIIPHLFMGFGALFTGFLALCLPETTGIDIPDNATEGEAFGLNQNFFYVPILKNLKKNPKISNDIELRSESS